MSREKVSPAATNDGAANQTSDEGAGIDPSVPDPVDVRPDPLADPAALCRGYAVLQIRRDERVTRHVYMSLHSAVKAQQRAEKAGRRAVLILVELVPILPAPIRVIDGGIDSPLGRYIDADTGRVIA